MAAGHVGGGPRLVDEDEAFRFQIDLAVEPVPALLQDVGTVLLDGMASLFLRVIPRRMKKRCNPATETVRPTSISARRSSSSEMSLRFSQMARMSPAHVAALWLRGKVTRLAPLRLPTDRRRWRNTKSRRRRAAAQAAINRRQKPRTQIHRERLSHPCWPPSPARSLNQKSEPVGIPARFKAVENRSSAFR